MKNTKFEIKLFDNETKTLIDPKKIEEGQKGHISYFMGEEEILYVLYDEKTGEKYRETGHGKGPILPILRDHGLKPYETGGYGGVPIGEFSLEEYKHWGMKKKGLVITDVNGAHKHRLEELLLELSARGLVTGGKVFQND